jgi:Lar family restriction alleviation protein
VSAETVTKPAKLLPCPFCGGTNIDAEHTICEHEGKDGFQAGCHTCNATGPTAPDAWMAAYRWNERRR